MAQFSKSSVKNTSHSSDIFARTPTLVEHKSLKIVDVYVLGSDEHPKLSLFSIPLNATNYLSQRHDVLTSLATKGKEGFILRTLPKPKFGDPNYNMWNKNNAMLRAWIRNSTSNELQGSFSYITNSKELWSSIKDKYSQCNGVMFSKLKHVISNVRQGDLSLTEYYSKFHKLMIELDINEPVNRCNYSETE